MGKGNRSQVRRQQEVASFFLTPAQQKAMHREINNQIIEHDKEYWLNIDALVLYAARRAFGCGKKRLHRLFDELNKGHEELLKYYEMDSEDSRWLCRYKLEQECKFDVEDWENSLEQEKKQDGH